MVEAGGLLQVSVQPGVELRHLKKPNQSLVIRYFVVLFAQQT